MHHDHTNETNQKEVKQMTNNGQAKTSPKTQTGKRGMCGSGMANNLNKGARCLEDIVQAKMMWGHTYEGDEGQALVQAAVAVGEAQDALAHAYNAYAMLKDNDLDPLPNNGSTIIGRFKGQVAILSTFKNDA